jgi:hypothetical protein
VSATASASASAAGVRVLVRYNVLARWFAQHLAEFSVGAAGPCIAQPDPDGGSAVSGDAVADTVGGVFGDPGGDVGDADGNADGDAAGDPGVIVRERGWRSRLVGDLTVMPTEAAVRHSLASERASANKPASCWPRTRNRCGVL